jgi:hypothetical protein
MHIGSIDVNLRTAIFKVLKVDAWLIVAALLIVLIGALLVPLNWIVQAVPDVTPADDSGEYRLAGVMEATANLPGGVEFQAVPIARWVKPALTRVTPSELRGLLVMSSDSLVESEPNGLWAFVSDAQQLSSLMTPSSGCRKNSIFLNRIPYTKSTATTDASFAVITEPGTDGSAHRSRFCFLSRKLDRAPNALARDVLGAPRVTFDGNWKQPINPPPIVIQYPEVKFEPPGPKTSQLPPIVLGSPPLKTADDWSTPKQLPDITIDRPAIVPTKNWSTPQHPPPLPVPSSQGIAEGGKSQPQASSGELTELGTVFFDYACPQLERGPRCWARDGIGERSSVNEQRTLISKAVRVLKDGYSVIFVIGSADPVGERAFNAGLAKIRAQTVAEDIEKGACPPSGHCPRDLSVRLIKHSVGEIPASTVIKRQPRQRRAEVFVYTPNDVLVK